MFRFRKRHDPVVNAIMRGVYFKDEPTDLDKGKYTNRFQLLKVPRLTKERILRVSPEQNYIISKTILMTPDITYKHTLLNPNLLYNQLTIKLTVSGDVYANFDLEILIEEPNSIDSEVFETNIVKGCRLFVKTFTFNPMHNISCQFINRGSTTILLNYTFSHSELEQPYVILLDSKIAPSTSIYRKFRATAKLINRMRVLLYQAGTLNAVIKLSQISGQANLKDEVVNESITVGSTYSNLFVFNEGSFFKLQITNNHATNDLLFQIILFFSKISQNNCLMKTGTYVGNGANNRQIPVGFTPKHLIIYMDNRPASEEYYTFTVNDQMIAWQAVNYNGYGQIPNIMKIIPNGFEVNNNRGNDYLNVNGLTFHYTAFG